jgi:hypothetical protein
LDGYAPPPVPVSLVHPGQGPLPSKLRAFLDVATPRLRAVLQDLSARTLPGSGEGPI